VSALAPLLQAFFVERLAQQRDASPRTIAAYRDSFRLLLTFVHQRTGTPPSRLQLEDLDTATITEFLSHLENERGNSVRTRNARLTAIHWFFHYAALKAPECAELIARVLSIPEKRYESTLINYLTDPEIDALLAAPEPPSTGADVGPAEGNRCRSNRGMTRESRRHVWRVMIAAATDDQTSPIG
jgi:site-specific recombinase XerD